MRRTKWQLSLLFSIVAALFISIVNAQQSNEKGSIKSIKTTTTKHTRSRKFQHTTTINNCSLASIQRSKSLSASKSTSTRLPNTQTVYVCSKRKHHVTKHGKQHHKKKTTTTTTTRRSNHHSKKKSLAKKPTSTRKSTSTKKKTTTTKKKTTTTTKKKTTTKKTTTKKSTKKTTASSTQVEKFNLPTTTEKSLPTQADPNSDDSTNDDQFIGAALPTQQEPAPSDVDVAPVAVPAPAHVPAPAPAPAINNTPKDNNNQVNAQTVETTETSDAEPQSKVIGVSVGAVVGCIAAVGLAGMFIYKRRERTTHDQDVEDMNQTSEVNTRWRTQSFMAVVAGAVAKLPKRSNSTSSNNGDSSGGVLGSIRRAASNASRSLSVRSKGSSRSSVQSYGIAVSGPVPAIARIDGDQAQYYGEPSSPTTGTHHTHAY